MPYRCECTICHDVRFHMSCGDFSETRCIKCGSLAFGLIQKTWVKVNDMPLRDKEQRPIVKES